MTLSERRLLARLTSLFYPNFGSCYRCHLKWVLVRGHSTPYGNKKKLNVVRKSDELTPVHVEADRSHACFCLCEECWAELLPTERLPFYRLLFEHWKNLRPAVSDDVWDSIRKAVLAGL